MRSMNGKKGFMAIKVDLEKAYDRLEWSFVKEILEEVGFDGKTIEIIWLVL